MIEREIPAHVIAALETLERASAPGSLGPAYQTLLDWRRNAPRSAPRVNLNPRDLITVLILLASGATAYLLFSTTSVEFQRGFITASGIGLALTLLSPSHRRPPNPTPTAPLSIDSRIDAAINRWRHLVPAMKDLPK